MTLAELKDTDYLGDGVYIGHDGCYIWLLTERENGTHAIALETIMVPLIPKYLERVRAKYADGTGVGNG